MVVPEDLDYHPEGWWVYVDGAAGSPTDHDLTHHPLKLMTAIGTKDPA